MITNKSDLELGSQYTLDASLVALGRLGVTIDKEFFAFYMSEIMNVVSNYKPSQIDDELKKYMREVYYPPFEERYGVE